MTNHEQLRVLAEAATPGPWSKHSNTDGWSASHDGIGSSEYRPVHGASGEVIALIVAESSEHWVDLDTKSNATYIAAASPDVVLALLDELHPAHMDGYEGGKQEARDAAHAEIDALRDENAQLKAELTALREQKPIGYIYLGDNIDAVGCVVRETAFSGELAIYAAPGAKE